MMIKPESRDGGTVKKRTRAISTGTEIGNDKALASRYSLPCPIQFPDDYIISVTTKQASKMTGLSVATLEKDRWKGGGIPYIKVGRSVRYFVTDILEFLESHRRNNTSQSA